MFYFCLLHTIIPYPRERVTSTKINTHTQGQVFVCVCVCVCVFVVALLSISKSKPDKNNKCFCLYHFAWCGLFNLIVLTAGHMQTVVPPLSYIHALSLSHSLFTTFEMFPTKFHGKVQ